MSISSYTLDVSKDHEIVPLKQKGCIPDYPICPKHSKKYCELHSQECDISICVKCVASQEHKSLAFVDMVTALETKKAKVIIGADANSDHYMVKTRIRLRLFTFKYKSNLRPRLDVECLKTWK